MGGLHSLRRNQRQLIVIGLHGCPTQRHAGQRELHGRVCHAAWAHLMRHLELSPHGPTAGFIEALQIRDTQKNMSAFTGAYSHPGMAMGANEFVSAQWLHPCINERICSSAFGADRADFDTQQHRGVVRFAAKSFLATVEQVANQITVQVVAAAKLGEADAPSIQFRSGLLGCEWGGHSVHSCAFVLV